MALLLHWFSGWLSQKSDESAHPHILMGILNGESCACADSRCFFVTTNLKTGVARL